MFAKLSLISFIYEILETFSFPDENVKTIFKKYGIERVEIFHVLTDTDSTSLKFIFISDPGCETPEDKYRDIIFEIITSSEIYKRFDSSPEFWEIFGVRKEQKRKKLGYFEAERIDNPCILTLVVNLKEYLELFEDKNLNKKHKGIKKGFDDLLELFQRQKVTCNDNCMGEDIKLDRLIVMGNVSGLADRSETFENFSIVSKKFGVTCAYAYILHTIYQTRNN